MEKKFNLNQDHRAVNIAIPVILVVLIIIGYRVFYLTLPSLLGGRSGDYILIAGIFSLFASAFLMWLLDPVIKYFLPSGQVLALNSEKGALTYFEADEEKTLLDGHPDWQIIRWTFKMGRFVKSGRERQIPRNWWCVAIMVKAEGEELTLFCYASPRIKRTFDHQASWEEISMYDTIEDDARSRNLPLMRPPTVADVIPGKLLVGEKGHVWLAERKRRENGMEMSTKDFGQLLSYLAGGK